MIIADIVLTQTVISDNIHGFAFCVSNAPVRMYPKGLNIGGTRGAKNTTSDKINSCSAIIYGMIK